MAMARGDVRHLTPGAGLPWLCHPHSLRQTLRAAATPPQALELAEGIAPHFWDASPPPSLPRADGRRLSPLLPLRQPVAAAPGRVPDPSSLFPPGHLTVFLSLLPFLPGPHSQLPFSPTFSPGGHYESAPRCPPQGFRCGQCVCSWALPMVRVTGWAGNALVTPRLSPPFQ